MTDTVDLKLPKRFTSKYFVTESGCWLWQASLDPNGYGRFSSNDHKLYAHRLVWMKEVHRYV